MIIKDEYIKRTDSFCEKSNMPTAEEMLQIAISESQESVERARSKIKLPSVKMPELKTARRVGRFAWGILAAATVVFLVTTNTIASGGGLGQLFKTFFEDETTSEIVEEGYVHTAGKEDEEDDYVLNYCGVTGDSANPLMLFEVVTKNEELKEYKTVEIEAYVLGKTQYETQLDDYATFEYRGEQSAEDPTLYRISDLGPSTWLVNETLFVIDVVKVSFYGEGLDTKEYYPDIYWEDSIPMNKLHPVEYQDLDNKPLPFGGVRYETRVGVYGSYETRICIGYDYVESELLAEIAAKRGIEDPSTIPYDDVEGEFLETWYEFCRETYLIIDGVEYPVDESTFSSVPYCDVKQEIGGPTRCYGNLFFAPFDYVSRPKVQIKTGDTVWDYPFY